MARQKQRGKRGSNGDSPKRAKAASTAPGVTVPATVQGRDLTPRLLVGLGASAGGLDAFKAFFANMPPQSGMGFVLVQHLDPHHKSLLVELLRNHTEMPVVQAEDGMRVAADQVFVIPPNAVLTIKAGVLRVATPAPPREHRKPIDTFFASLAEDQQEMAVSIILSGSGSDGCGTLATTIAIAIARGPKSNDDHSSASDLATSASAGGHRRVAVDASC